MTSVYPFIVAITCEKPILNANLEIIPDKTSYSYNERVKFSCSAGFKLTGKSEEHCQQTGDFQRNLPQCTGKMWIFCEKMRLKYVD